MLKLIEVIFMEYVFLIIIIIIFIFMFVKFALHELIIEIISGIIESFFD